MHSLRIPKRSTRSSSTYGRFRPWGSKRQPWKLVPLATASARPGYTRAMRRYAVLVVAACGSGQHVTPVGAGSAATGPSTKSYGVLGIRDDAKAVSQAVILGSDERNGSIVIPLPDKPARAAIDTVWDVPDGERRGVGGITTIALGTTPLHEETTRAQLEVTGDVGSAAPAWHASLWLSAMVAAATLNKDLTDYAFTAVGSGNVDGASASALVAAGYLAAMTGTAVDTAVTITGIVNPDGTLGPVGGLPDKLAIAIARGKTKNGFPAGMRMAHSDATGEAVDLVELARQKGAEAVELTDVHDAYRLLTGRDLPRPVPVAATDMAADPEVGRALTSTLDQLQHAIATPWASVLLLEQVGRLPPTIDRLRDRAKRGVDAAQRLRGKGELAAANRRLAEAWQAAEAAARAYELVERIKAGDSSGADRRADRARRTRPTRRARCSTPSARCGPRRWAATCR